MSQRLPISQIGNRGTEEFSRWTRVFVMETEGSRCQHSHLDAIAPTLNEVGKIYHLPSGLEMQVIISSMGRERVYLLGFTVPLNIHDSK